MDHRLAAPGIVAVARAGPGRRAPGLDPEVGRHPDHPQHVRLVAHEQAAAEALALEDGGHRLERLEGRPTAVLREDPVRRDAVPDCPCARRGGLGRPVVRELAARDDEERRVALLVQLDGVLEARAEDGSRHPVELRRAEDDDRVCFLALVERARGVDPVGHVADEHGHGQDDPDRNGQEGAQQRPGGTGVGHDSRRELSAGGSDGGWSASGCSAPVALLVLEARAAPAGVVAPDLGARRRVAGTGLLPVAAAGRAGHPRRPAHAWARDGPEAAARAAGRASRTATAGAGARPDRDGAAGWLARAAHREGAGRRLRLLLLRDLGPEDRARDLVADESGELLVQPEGLLAELVERVLLGIAAQADAAAHVVELGQVLDPQRIDRAQEHEPLDRRPQLRPDLLLAGLEHLVGDLAQVLGDRGGGAELEELRGVDPVAPDAHPPELDDELGDRLLRRGVMLAPEVALDDLLEVLVLERADRLGQVLVAEDLVALGVDGLALAVDDVVELDDALADVEVEAFDAALGALDRLADDAGLDVVLLVEPEALHHRGDPLRGKALHQVVVEREVEARRAGVPLPARAASELVVDAAALVALRADDVQAAGLDDPLVVLVGDLLRLGEGRRVGVLVDLGRVETLPMEDLGGETRRVAAEQDVRAAAGHVRGDRHGAAAARLGDDPRLLLVELRVQDLVLDAAALQQLGEPLGLLDRDRADEDRPAGLLHLLDLVDDGVELGLLVAVDEVGLVVADHRPVGRDADDLEVVDLVELLGLGHRRAGHAGELVVEAEVVLERDRGHRHALALDPEPLLGLDRLVEALAPAPPGHLAARELVDDDDLAVLDDVVAVALVERVGPEGLVEVAGEARVGVVEVVDPEQLLDLLDTGLRRRDGFVLEVDEVVALVLVALDPVLGPLAEARYEPGHRVIEVAGLLSVAADDQRRAGLVDEDVVDLVDDREVALALHP